MNRIKKSFGVFVAALALLALPVGVSVLLTGTTGCAFLKGDSTVPWQEDIAVSANLAAYIGASVDIKDNPSRRAVWLVSKEALDSLIRDSDYNPASFMGALQKLPIKELKSSKSTLVVGSAVMLWGRLAARIDINQVELVRIALPAVRNGIKQALEENP